MRFTAHAPNHAANNTNGGIEHIWDLTSITFFAVNIVFCGFNVIVVSYLTRCSRRAFLPFLIYSSFCVAANVLAFPHVIFMTYYINEISKSSFYAVYVLGFFADVSYCAASYQLLYIYLERLLRMHYPFRFRLLPKASHQILFSCLNVVIVVGANAGVIFFITHSYTEKSHDTEIVLEDDQFAEKYPIYHYLDILDAVASVLVPAAGICLLARINNSKLAAMRAFNRSSGCWNIRGGGIVSMEAWIHKEVRLCTSMALLHIFLFLPDAILGIVYNTSNSSFGSSKAYNITEMVIRTIQLASMSAHTAVFLAFCPAYRQAIIRAIDYARLRMSRVFERQDN